MKIISSYATKIVGHNDIFAETINVYRKALAYVIEVCDKEWEHISQIELSKLQINAIESLIHSTNNNIAKYLDFDSLFYKFPSYLRRDVISTALGKVKSYHSNLANWNATSQKTGKPPRLNKHHHEYPCMFRTNMYQEVMDNWALIKIFHQNDWIWLPVQLRQQDVKYLKKYWSHSKAKAPILEKKGRAYYLRFAFEERIPLSETHIMDQRILAVDLGYNTDATCSVMTSDGTILARKFINFSSEKDHLYHGLNKLKQQQRRYGSKSTSKIWRYLNRCNTDLSIKIAIAITSLATEYNVDAIVFEYLDFKGKKMRGSKAQRLHLWRKNGIQDLVTHKAHRCGIRISRICAWNTSRYAYDGSGTLERDVTNKALATFKNGKQYNCDLSASYNIGARYFIREILKTDRPKPLSQKIRSRVVANVPDCEKRTTCTLSTLWSLSAELKAQTTKAV